MQWSDTVNEHIQAIKHIPTDADLIKRIYASLDLTSLNADDTNDSIATLCSKAQSRIGRVAAVCVFPKFIEQAATLLTGSGVKIATVVNFPQGNMPQDDVLAEITHCVQLGANEIDVVFPYERYLAGEGNFARHFIEACKSICDEKALLKVILETGALVDAPIIADASYDAISGGADFIKTSTGKIAQGASLEAAATMLLVIKHAQTQFDRRVGIKISGGVRTLEQAGDYLALAEQIMGDDWVSPATFRIGASKLVDELIA